MKFKPGVVLPIDMDGRLSVAMDAVREVFSQRPHLGEPWITSFYDGIHSARSYHYKGRAFDIRTKGTGSARWIHHEIRARLSALGFDVVLEALGEENEHIHIEIDKRADTLAHYESLKRNPSDGSPDGGTESGEA